MSTLKNIQIGFGDSVEKAKALSLTQINKIIKTIQDPTINTNYSGHIKSLKAIPGSKVYVLELNGMRYSGPIGHDEYTLSLSQTQITEGNSVTVTPTSDEELPLEAFTFKIKSVVVESGNITVEELQPLCSVNGNKITVADSQKNEVWTGLITIESSLIFDSENTKTIVLTAKGARKIKDFTVSPSNITVNSKNQAVILNIDYIPSDYIQELDWVRGACEDSKIDVQLDTTKTLKLIVDTTESFETEVNITAGGITKTHRINIKAASSTKIDVIGTDVIQGPIPKIKFTSATTKQATFEFNGLVPMDTVEAKFAEETTTYFIQSCDKNGISILCTGVDNVEENIINLKAVDLEGNEVTAQIELTNKIVPTVSLPEEAVEFDAPNGNGQVIIPLTIEPSKYNVQLDVVKIELATPDMGCTYNSNAKSFIVTSKNLTEDKNHAFYITFNIDDETVTKYLYVKAKYREIIKPFVIYNPTASPISFSFMKNGSPNELPLQTAIVDDYTDDESYDFDSVELVENTITENTTITLESGQAIMIFSSITTWRTGDYPYWHFNIKTKGLIFGGDVYGLVNGLHHGAIKGPYAFYNIFKDCTGITTAPKLSATSLTDHCYDSMFDGCTSLETAPELPAISLTDYCYYRMFNGCTKLVNVPKLPATNLTERCYANMFRDCKSLVTAPKLPATNLAKECYFCMFFGCTSLVNVPELPATTLAYCCYQNMFTSCSSLVNAPALPATTLAEHCYKNMFAYCTSLETAPELLATTLVSFCYDSMFDGCTKLSYIKALFLTSPSNSYTGSWTRNVASRGTFIKNKNATWSSTGADAIPLYWTVETAIN